MARHYCPRCGVETVFFISAEAEERCSCCSRMLQKFLRDDTDAPAKGRPRLPETHPVSYTHLTLPTILLV